MGGERICDIGCGDGRNLILFDDLGFDTYGIEISKDIVKAVYRNLAIQNVILPNENIRCGTNSKIPFEDNYFDYLVSWNSCYYMENGMFNFGDYVKEYRRVLKPGGKFIFSIPMLSHSCFKDVTEEKRVNNNLYKKVANYYFSILNGTWFRAFISTDDIKKSFPGFHNWIFGNIVDNCFGLNNHWYIGVCERRKEG